MEEVSDLGERDVELATMHSSSPLPTQPVGGWKAVTYILGNETFEKLASMSLLANLVLYLHTKYNLDNVVSANLYNIWSGSCNVSPLIGAYLADSHLGKFSTLLYSLIASLMGMVVLTLTSSLHELTPPACNGQAQCEQPNAWQNFVLYFGLGLLVIGSGGLRPCNIAFGADQFDTTTEKGRAQLDSFCNWWYFLFTIAILVAMTGVVYIQTNISWVLGFAIPAGCFALSILIFVLGRKLYVRVKPQGSTFGDIMRVIIASFRKFSTKTSGQHLYDVPSIVQESEQTLAHTERFKFLDKAAVIVDPNELDCKGNPQSGWRLCSVHQVEQLKCIIALFPVWVCGIGCFIGMQQMPSFGTFQAIQTNRKIGKNFEIPPAWMGLTPMIALSIWIIIYESIYIPWTQRRNNDDFGRLTMETRFRVGIVMSILCMVVAGLTEMKRRNSALENRSFESPISVALLVPEYALSGLIEAFAAIALMELLTTQWPKSMRTFAGAAFFLSLSIASFCTSILVSIVNKVTNLNGNTSWLGGDDLNKNRLDYYYYTIAVLGALNLLYFELVARHSLSDVDGRDRSRTPSSCEL